MILFIDNYDSFTWNLVHYLGSLGHDIDVKRNDEISLEEVKDLSPAALFLSPGPSDPDHAGICLDLVNYAAKTETPLFGVCLGHQTIGQFFGGDVIRAPQPMHGKIDTIQNLHKGALQDLPDHFKATRYHSLIVDEKTLPDCLEITAKTDDNSIMGLKHKSLPIEGVQFHPESIASEHGLEILNNFLKRHCTI